MGIDPFGDTLVLPVDDQVLARLHGQACITCGSTASPLAPAGHRFVVLMEESVLHNRVGGPSVMRDQLEQLRESARLPSLALGIIPVTATRNPIWQVETFYMFDSERVIVENLTAEINVTAPSEIAQYERAFLALGSLAVYGSTARRLIDKALDNLA